MARVEHDFTQPGRFQVFSSDPGALARVPDVLHRAVGQPNDVLAAWALHPSEQDGSLNAAYHDELEVIGPHALAHVEELARPRERNVVWVDRYHLTCAAVQPHLGGPLLGLYVTTKGRIAIYVYPPDGAHSVTHRVANIPHAGRGEWDDPPTEPMARYMVSWTPARPGSVTVALSQHFVPDVSAELQQLPA